MLTEEEKKTLHQLRMYHLPWDTSDPILVKMSERSMDPLIARASTVH